ncbi:MAG: hypothetical protein CVV11_06230 [Gammaproteobacteria bacterium HGW-Gammaproteobacteria-15]|nr:MAG: hypothetical protein CVV11_06230 [Gammaproteobacteria bacterium HGW-Gammaproteobacteria-15]
MEFFKNVSINLKARGPAAVLVIWMLCLTILALYGESTATYIVLGILSGFGFAVLTALGSGSEE